MMIPQLNKIYTGNCLNHMKEWPDGFIDCCITSPPYYGLRDYKTGRWDGGDENCEHSISELNDNLKPHVDRPLRNGKKRGECKHCGAIRIDEQIGLEESPEAYVAKLVDVFSEVKRVLKKDGTLWLNLGDSYAGSGRGANENGKQGTNKGTIFNPETSGKTYGLKPKDLIGIPWSVAFALRSSGWYLRQDIIWSKPNPMPESVTDRCTKAHEYIFLLTKSQKYYYDQEAIGSIILDDTIKRYQRGWNGNGDRGFPNGPQNHIQNFMDPDNEKRTWANKKSVWTVTTQPYPEAHFATFPEELIEPCVLTTRPDAIIYDPFGGSGTTGVVALRAGRKFILSELNPTYVKLAEKRLHRHMNKML